jgi:formate hydrogenlyase transcriptional activator
MIAATHRDLPAMIQGGKFRQDLFYRFNVFPVEIPALRDRREDIPLLVPFFVSRFCRRMKKAIRSIAKESMKALVNAEWPGNIRELENFIERCVILTQGNELNVPRTELQTSAIGTVAPASLFRDAERQVIIDALKNASGKIAGKDGAAERLGLKRTTLQNKMRRLSIARADYSQKPWANPQHSC